MSWRSPYGYNWSENGWRMCDRNECDIVRIPDLFLTETAPLRKGPPLVILGAWMFWFDRNVEEIATSIWGWSAENKVPNSNHLSGTAIDVNAPKHPWGISAQNNFSKAQIAKIREGLHLFEGTVHWGEDWAYKDPMHFQMNFPEGNPANDRFMKKLLDGHLGIYKNAPPKVGSPVAKSNEQRIKDTREQLAGFDPSGKEEFVGWSQLGNRTVVNALAAIGEKLEIPGFKAPK